MSTSSGIDPGAQSPTWYRATLPARPVRPALEGVLSADVVIVGGGHTGVASALELAERGLSVVLLEASRIGDGATGRNGGQVTGSLSGLSAMRRQLNRRIGSQDTDAVLRELRWGAQTLIRDRVARYAIDCDLKEGHLHAAWRRSDIGELHTDLEDAHAAGLVDRARWLSRSEVHALLDTPLYHGGVLNRHNLHLNSLKLCEGEAVAAESLGVRIFENSEVLDIESLSDDRRSVAITTAGRVEAEHVLLAGNAYHSLRRAELKGLMFPAVLGNLATAPLDEATRQAINPEELAVYDSRLVLDYYRPTADGRLMFGGGTNYSGRDLTDVAAALRPRLERTFPRLAGVAIDYAWTGRAGIVPNRIPLLGRLPGGIVYAQGYSGHGIASSHLTARAIADAFTGRSERFDTLSSLSHRSLPGGQLTLTVAMLMAAGSDHARTLMSRLFYR